MYFKFRVLSDTEEY